MKLLFDQNISPKLVNALKKTFPNSEHVQNVGLETAMDSELWNFAKENNYVIVTKDADFSEKSLLFGFPPKVIWIRRGNCSTSETEKMLHDSEKEIKAMNKNKNIGLISLF